MFHLTVFITLLSSQNSCNYNKKMSFFGNAEVLIGSTYTGNQDLHIDLSWKNCLISVDTAPTPSAWITWNRSYVREVRIRPLIFISASSKHQLKCKRENKADDSQELHSKIRGCLNSRVKSR